ncbi:putative gpi anchored [Rosellinia necatrix]|uniref:Putative gpi anchored n=1 Tax=Rosellinia necatrix TaxID=77044 RepID=A0A1W2TRG8_ROSNE|nr:putative gpi anchored [Rosellinia necatrix]
MLRSVVTAALLLATTANAHFTVQYPDTVGPFKDDDEDKEPCGGYSPSLSDVTTVDFHVGGDSIATKSTHPQTNWLYRITTDAIVKNNWTQVYGIVQQSGPGDYCSNAVTIPEEYVGQKAILSIVGAGIDGVLYQCSAVLFVNGTAETPSACVNGTSITASYTTDDQLSGLVSSSTVGDSTGDASGSSSTPSPTTTPNAAPSLQAFAAGGFGALMTTGAMMLAGFAFMI